MQNHSVSVWACNSAVPRPGSASRPKLLDLRRDVINWSVDFIVESSPE
jgi:hypothetical protein